MGKLTSRILRFTLVILLSVVHDFMWSVSCYNSASNGGSSEKALNDGPLMQDDDTLQSLYSWYGAKTGHGIGSSRHIQTGSSGTQMTSGSNPSSESFLEPVQLVMGSPVVQQVALASGQFMTQSSSQIVQPVVQQFSQVASNPNSKQLAQASFEAMTQTNSQQLTHATDLSLIQSESQQSHSQPSNQQPVHVVSGTIVQPTVSQQSVLASSQPNSPFLAQVSSQSVAQPFDQQPAQARYQSVQASAQQLPQAGYQSVAQAGGLSLIKPHKLEGSQIVSRLFPCTRPVQNRSVGFFKPGMPGSESVVKPVTLHLQAFAQAPTEQHGQSSYQYVAEDGSQQSSQASGAPGVQASYQSVREFSGQQPLQASYQSVFETSGLSEAHHFGHHSAAQSSSQQLPFESYKSVSQVSGQQPVQGLFQSVAPSSSNHQSVAQSSSHLTAQGTDVSAEQSSSQKLPQTSYQSVNHSRSQQLTQASSLSVAQSSSQQPLQASYPSLGHSTSPQLAEINTLSVAQSSSQQPAFASYSSVVHSSSPQPAQAAFESVSQTTGQKPALGRYPPVAKPVAQQPAEENLQLQGQELFQIGTKLYSCYEVVSQPVFDQHRSHSGQSRYHHQSTLSSPPSSQPAVMPSYQALVKPVPSSYGSALSPSHQVSARPLQSGFMPKPAQSGYEPSAQQEQPSSLPFVGPGPPSYASTLLGTDKEATETSNHQALVKPDQDADQLWWVKPGQPNYRPQIRIEPPSYPPQTFPSHQPEAKPGFFYAVKPVQSRYQAQSSSESASLSGLTGYSVASMPDQSSSHSQSGFGLQSMAKPSDLLASASTLLQSGYAYPAQVHQTDSPNTENFPIPAERQHSSLNKFRVVQKVKS